MIVKRTRFIHETVLLKETVASVLNVTVAEPETGAIIKTGTLSMRHLSAVGTADCC